MTEFSGKLQHQAWMVKPETQKVMQALLENGGDARFVGGCVRNALVNRKVLDIDIATPLLPEQVIDRLKHHKIAYAPVGLKHGTVTAIVEGHPFEITTLRRDVSTDGRHAEVAFTDDWKMDASRRDFTINAMFATVDGDVLDPFGGVEDLRQGVVRFVGEAPQRIHEDVLRILRFFRFYAHFGRGEPDTAALKACTEAAAGVAKLSADRVRREVLKLLESNNSPAAWRLMLNCGVVANFLPEANDVKTLESLVHLEAQYHRPPFPLRRLAALLKVTPVGLPQVAQKLNLSKEQAEQLALMMNPDMGVSMQMGTNAVKKLVYRHGGDAAHTLLLLTAARTGETEKLKFLYHTAASFRPPKFPLRGDDVLKLGVKPGPEVGRILGEIEHWWIEQDFRPDRGACMEKLKEACN